MKRRAKLSLVPDDGEIRPKPPAFAADGPAESATHGRAAPKTREGVSRTTPRPMHRARAPGTDRGRPSELQARRIANLILVVTVGALSAYLLGRPPGRGKG